MYDIFVEQAKNIKQNDVFQLIALISVTSPCMIFID